MGADVDLHIHNDDFHRLEDDDVQHRVKADGHFLRKHANNNSWLLQANDHNYLLIELNKRREYWNPEKVWQVPIEGRLFPAMEDAHLNLSSWYGLSFFKHRLRHVPEWEEEHRPMFCATPYLQLRGRTTRAQRRRLPTFRDLLMCQRTVFRRKRYFMFVLMRSRSLYELVFEILTK